MDDLPEVQMSSQKNSHCHVNRKLLPIKGFYFAFLAAVGSLLPFITYYMKQLGLSSSETGILYGTMPFVGFFVRPIIGAMADHWHKHKLMLMVCSVLTGLFYLLILTIPRRVHHTLMVHTQLDCNVQDSFFRDCVSASDRNADHSTCNLRLSEFADFMLNMTNGNGMDLDCEVHCTDSPDSANQEVALCFTDDTEEFVKHCNGTLVTKTPFAFTLLNISHMLNSEVMQDRIAEASLQCRDYDLKSLQHNSQRHWQLLCDEEGTFQCEMTCKHPPPQFCPNPDHRFDSTFGWLFLIYLIANLAFAPVFSLSDAITFDTLGKKHHKFGEQRLWGTVGFAASAITSTFIMYMMTKQGSSFNLTVPFYIFAILCCLAAAIAHLMSLSSNIKCGKMFENFLALMRVPQVLVFLAVVLFFGMATGAVEGFLFWYLANLGATTLVFGLSLVVNCLFEVPLLFASGVIIKHIGAVPCLYLAMMALALRFLGYSLLSNPWVVLAIEPLHGVTFGIMWAAASTNAALIAPPGMSATVQGLVSGVHFGIGKGLGSLLTGFLFDRVGERWSFRVYAIMSVCLLVLYGLLNQLVFKSHARPSVPQQFEGKTDRSSSDQGNDQPLLPAAVGVGPSSIDSNHSLEAVKL